MSIKDEIAKIQADTEKIRQINADFKRKRQELDAAHVRLGLLGGLRGKEESKLENLAEETRGMYGAEYIEL